jgi:ATP-binding protein involved in chromosome partitioning
MSLKILQKKPEHNLCKVKYIIGIAAGKGGVGKSTVSVNLALALKAQGHQVGLMDADIYGPSLRKMLPEETMPAQSQESSERIIPALCFGMKAISMAFFGNTADAAVVRAPIANGLIQQFIHQVEWGELDFLLIDFPPGTGDIQLTLAQQGSLSGAIVVTTPQEVALLDVRKAVQMFAKLSVPLIGVVENMSYFCDPATGQKHYLFGREGGQRLAEEAETAFLGDVPIDPALSACGDLGQSVFVQAPNSLGAQAFETIAAALLTHLPEREDELTAFYQKDPMTLTLEWREGGISEFNLGELQNNCLCARCEINKPIKNEAVTARSISRIGRYALRIEFNRGCSKGIYPFTYLKRLYA